MDFIGFKNDGTYVMGLKGKLDALTSPAFREQLIVAIDQGERDILLDCSDLDYVSSAGLRVLFEAAFKLQELSGRFDCCSVNPNVRKIFDLVDLPSEIPLFASREEALRVRGGA